MNRSIVNTIGAAQRVWFWTAPGYPAITASDILALLKVTIKQRTRMYIA